MKKAISMHPSPRRVPLLNEWHVYQWYLSREIVVEHIGEGLSCTYMSLRGTHDRPNIGNLPSDSPTDWVRIKAITPDEDEHEHEDDEEEQPWQ